MEQKLPSSWTKASLSELGMGRTETIDPSNSPDKQFELWSVPSFPTGKPEVARGKEIGSTKQRVCSGDVLLCKINPRINRVWVVGEKNSLDQIASTEWIVFRNHGLDSNYLSYAFRDSKFRNELTANVAGVGGSLTRARPSDVANLLVQLAPLNEQHRMVAKLDALFERSRNIRDKLDHLPRLLDKLRKSILHAAFTGELIQQMNGGNTHTWQESTVGDVLEDLRYGTSKKCIEDPHGIAVLRIPNIGSRGLETNNLKYAEFDTEEYRKLALKAGDILLIRSNGSVDLVGKTGVVTEREAGMLFAGYLIRLRCQKHIVPEYLHYWLASTQLRTKIELTAKSTSGVNNINSDEVRGLPLRFPILAEQAEICKKIAAGFALVDALFDRQRTLANKHAKLDSALLARAFRGELVPQDPNDEPASVLLERIKAERAIKTPAKRSKRGSVATD